MRNAFAWRRNGKTWPIRTQLPWQAIRFEGNGGADLAARWFPADAARGTVVLAHPDRRHGQQWFLTHGWVEFLLDARYNVLTFDFAGYGGSRGGSTYLFEDVIAAAHEARRRGDGLPVHLIGLSIGAFSAANAAPHLDFVESIVLESPFPSFNAWYGRGWGRFAMAAFDRLFPRTAALIQADENIARAKARRILLVAGGDDSVTPSGLTLEVLRRAPVDRTEFLLVEGAAHLELFERSAAYRDAILRTLRGAISEPMPAAAPAAVPIPIPA